MKLALTRKNKILNVAIISILFLIIMTPKNSFAYGLCEFAQKDDVRSMQLRIEFLDVNEREKGGVTPLMCAAIKGYTRPMKFLLENDADINATTDEGETALMLAAGIGKVEAVKLLLAARADVNVKSDKGLTALDIAISKGRPEIVKLLKEAGAKE